MCHLAESKPTLSHSKSQSRPELRRHDCMSVLVHDVVVVGPVPAPNVSMAKGLAAEEARRVLADPESPHHLSRVCVCAEEKAAVEAAKDKMDVDKTELDDETTEGFATLARILLDEVQEPGLPPATDAVDDHTLNGDDNEIDLPAEQDETFEEMEVEEMMEVDA